MTRRGSRASGKRSSAYARADSRTREAKAAGYPARSVFKLEEIQRRCRVLQRGYRVLDLGASPGSWALFASKQVGAEGSVIAIDLNPLEGGAPPNVLPIQADVFDLNFVELMGDGPFQLVMSDMAPKTSGSKVQDQARSMALCERALEVAVQVGDAGSGFVCKLLMGPQFAELQKRVREHYEVCRVVRPSATRQQSSEVFLVGMNAKRSALGAP